MTKYLFIIPVTSEALPGFSYIFLSAQDFVVFFLSGGGGGVLGGNPFFFGR